MEGIVDFYYGSVTCGKLIGTAEVIVLEILGDCKMGTRVTFKTGGWYNRPDDAMLGDYERCAMLRPYGTIHVMPLHNVKCIHMGQEIVNNEFSTSVYTYQGIIGHDFRNGLERAKEKACQMMQLPKTTTESK